MIQFSFRGHVYSPFKYFCAGVDYLVVVLCTLLSSLYSLSPGRIQKFHACIQFSTAEIACLWSLLCLPWPPWQWPSPCRPLWRQIALGVHSDPWEARSVEGSLMYFVSGETWKVVIVFTLIFLLENLVFWSQEYALSFIVKCSVSSLRLHKRPKGLWIFI